MLNKLNKGKSKIETALYTGIFKRIFFLVTFVEKANFLTAYTLRQKH
jgi:hypothetical protein